MFIVFTFYLCDIFFFCVEIVRHLDRDLDYFTAVPKFDYYMVSD